MPFKKAQYTQETIFKIFLFVFVLLILLLLGKGLAEVLNEILGFHFRPPPQAAANVIALRCAIDSVAYGAANDYTCVKGVDIPREVKVAPIKNYGDAILYIKGAKILQQSLFSKIWYQLDTFFTGGKKNNYVGYVYEYVGSHGLENNTVVVCGNMNSFKDESDSVKKFFNYLSTSDDYKCMVFNFELPQVHKPMGVGNALIPNLGDPDYIVYYEKFPAGEEKAWLDTSDSWGTTGILIAGAIAAIPVAGSMLRAAFTEGSKVALDMLRSSIIFWRGAQESAEIGIRDALLYEARKAGAELTQDDAGKIAKLITKGELDDATEELVRKGMSREEAEELVSDWAWARGMKGKDLDVAFKFEREFTDYLIDPKTGTYFGLKSDEFNEFMSKWMLLPDNTPQEFSTKAKLFGKFVKGEPVEIKGKVYQLSPEDVMQINKFIEDRNKKLIGTYYRYYKRLPANVRRLYNKQVDELLYTYLKNSRSLRLAIIEGLGYAGVFDKYSMGKVDVDGDGVPDDVFLENVMKCMAVIPNTGIVSAIVGKGACVILSAMGWAAIWMEARTYYKPVGVNSLGLYYPIVWFLYGKSVEYPLIKEAMPYYIYLGRAFDPTRLYLVSPCKAVLYVEKTKMDCLIPLCDAYYKYEKQYTYNSDIYSSATDYYQCKNWKGECTVPSDYKKAGDKGYCYCIDEDINPCYDQKKCDEWAKYYLGCFKYKGYYTPYALYTVDENGVKSSFLVGGVDYSKVKELTNDVKGFKVCAPPAWWDVKNPFTGEHMFSTTFTVNAIKVTPVLYNVNPNYCYWGKGDVGYMIQKISVLALFTGIDLLVGESPLVVLTAMGYAYADEKVDEQYRWWNHPDELIPSWLAPFVPFGPLLNIIGEQVNRYPAS